MKASVNVKVNLFDSIPDCDRATYIMPQHTPR